MIFQIDQKNILLLDEVYCIDKGNWLEHTPFLLIFIHWLGKAEFMQQLYCSFESKYSLLEIAKKPRHLYILLRLPKQKRNEGWPTNPTKIINLVELKNDFFLNASTSSFHHHQNVYSIFKHSRASSSSIKLFQQLAPMVVHQPTNFWIPPVVNKSSHQTTNSLSEQSANLEAPP